MQEAAEEEEFKVHALPLARIKKIMKSDEDVRVSEQLWRLAAAVSPAPQPRPFLGNPKTCVLWLRRMAGERCRLE